MFLITDVSNTHLDITFAVLLAYIMTYLHVFFFVPPRAPWRAFRNHVMKSTASPAEHRTEQKRQIVGDLAAQLQDIYWRKTKWYWFAMQVYETKQMSLEFWMIKLSTTVLAKKSIVINTGRRSTYRISPICSI